MTINNHVEWATTMQCKRQQDLAWNPNHEEDKKLDTPSQDIF